MVFAATNAPYQTTAHDHESLTESVSLGLRAGLRPSDAAIADDDDDEDDDDDDDQLPQR